MTAYTYRADFFDYIEDGSVRSAEIVVPAVRTLLDVASVLDVGCGRGAWLSEWRRRGIEDIVGVDGAYVAADRLLIPTDRFMPRDLAQPIDLGRQFDVVQSLEVAEHLAESAADVFIDNLVRHGSVILFSAAVPGQGGEHHVNERPYRYWRDKFLARGYVLFDAVRPLLAGDRRIEPWYRYNMLLFASRSAVGRLAAAAQAQRVDDDTAVADVSPVAYRARKFALRMLPAVFVSRLAMVKHGLVNLLRRSRQSPPDQR
jgi:SAM-dependent methyltransferase